MSVTSVRGSPFVDLLSMLTAFLARGIAGIVNM